MRSTAMPGMNCPVRATSTRGSARLNTAARLNCGLTHCGDASSSTSASLRNAPLATVTTVPTHSTAATA
ncbi:hypothetical protein D3C75_992120 [compost metagenome]